MNYKNKSFNAKKDTKRTRIFEQIKKHISGLNFRQLIINKLANRRNGFRWFHFSLWDLLKRSIYLV